MEKANAAEAEMDAKFEAEREMAIREAERKIKEEREIRKKVSKMCLTCLRKRPV